MSYSVLYSPAASEEQMTLPPWQRREIVQIVRVLREEPRPWHARPLSHREELYAVYEGNYKLSYRIWDQSSQIVVFAIRCFDPDEAILLRALVRGIAAPDPVEERRP